MCNPFFSLEPEQSPQSIAWCPGNQMQTVLTLIQLPCFKLFQKITIIGFIGVGFIRNNTGVFLNTGGSA